MSSIDLPDGTRKIIVDIDISPTLNFIPTLAEGKNKDYKDERITSAGNLCEITPADGKGIYLLVMILNADTDGDGFDIQTLQSSVWTDIMDKKTVWAYGHYNMTFPCWYPTQDTGDGSTKTFRVVASGTGPWSGFILYYEDTPPT